MTLGEWMDQMKEEEIAEARAEAKAEGRAEGRAEGKAEGERLGRIKTLLDILLDLGVIPTALEACLYELEEETLKKWIKVAVRAESLEEFLKTIEWEQV